jgi:hypothetical protein
MRKKPFDQQWQKATKDELLEPGACSAQEINAMQVSKY